MKESSRHSDHNRREKTARRKEMKKILLCVVTITLLISACSSAKTSAVETPATIQESQSQGSEATNAPALVQAPSPTHTPPAVEEATAGPEAQSVNLPAATRTPYPTQTLYPTYTPRPTNTPVATATPTQKSEEIASQAEAPAATLAPAPAQTLPLKSSTASAVDLTRIADPDPAPPLTILVSAIRIAQNGNYRVTGTVRNDSSETYGGIGIIATFYEEEKPCTERQVTRRRRDGTEETVTEEVCDYNWHGPVEVRAMCTLLEPGAECPFSLEIYPQDYVAYMLHPEGAPVAYRQVVTLALSHLNVYNNGLGYVRLTGTVTNDNSFTVRDARVIGTLLDAAGQIVSVGSIVVPGEITPGAGVDFDLRITYESYSRYELSAQATQH
jgi:hypothetical protein